MRVALGGPLAIKNKGVACYLARRAAPPAPAVLPWLLDDFVSAGAVSGLVNLVPLLPLCGVDVSEANFPPLPAAPDGGGRDGHRGLRGRGRGAPEAPRPRRRRRCGPRRVGANPLPRRRGRPLGGRLPAPARGARRRDRPCRFRPDTRGRRRAP